MHRRARRPPAPRPRATQRPGADDVDAAGVHERQRRPLARGSCAAATRRPRAPRRASSVAEVDPLGVVGRQAQRVRRDRGDAAGQAHERRDPLEVDRPGGERRWPRRCRGRRPRSRPSVGRVASAGAARSSARSRCRPTAPPRRRRCRGRTRWSRRRGRRRGRDRGCRGPQLARRAAERQRRLLVTGDDLGRDRRSARTPSRTPATNSAGVATRRGRPTWRRSARASAPSSRHCAAYSPPSPGCAPSPRGSMRPVRSTP